MLDTRSEEHIIPEALGNKKHTLPNVCRRLNNYMACSFETHVITTPAMKHALLLVEPRPKKNIYLGTAKTARGTTEHRWLVQGQEILSSLPEYEETSEVIVSTTDNSGKSVELKIELPFKVLKYAKSGPASDLKAERRIRKEREDLSRYFKELVANPQINPRFNKLLQENNARLGDLRSVEATTKPGQELRGVVKDLLPLEHPLNEESWAKFFMKIAWTHAHKTLGPLTLQNPIGNKILSYILSGHFQPPELAQRTPELFRSATVDGETLYFWSRHPRESLTVAEQLTTPDLQYYLVPAARRRIQSLNEHVSLLKIKTPVLPNLNTADIEPFKRHTLKLLDIQVDNQPHGACHIMLFGDLFEAIVLISDRSLGLEQERTHSIEF